MTNIFIAAEQGQLKIPIPGSQGLAQGSNHYAVVGWS